MWLGPVESQESLEEGGRDSVREGEVMGAVMQLQKGTRRQGIQAASKETHSPHGLQKECSPADTHFRHLASRNVKQ